MKNLKVPSARVSPTKYTSEYLARFFREYWPEFAIIATLVMIGIILPIIWLHGGLVVAGHDAGLPFDPIKHFTNRFYVWTERIGFGADQSHELGAVPIHGLEALITAIFVNPHKSQLVMFAIWLILPGLSVYTALRGFFGRRRYFILFFGSLFYSYNHFLLQSWWIFERTKYTLYVALPVILLLLFRFFLNKAPIVKTAIALALLIFVFNGGGFIPLFGAVIIASFGIIAYFLFLDYSKQNILRLLKLLGLTVLISIPLNAYWILPYLILFQESFASGLSQIGGVDTVLQWADYISRDASLYNLLRLQGIIDWSGNALHPYASQFTSNIFLLGVSYLLMPLAFLSLLVVKEKRDRIILTFFSLLALLSTIFIGGTHEPLGFIFTFLMQHVPGFVVFRTPYYKFAPALWLSYCVLISYTLWRLKEMIVGNTKAQKVAKILIPISAVIILGLYNYPYFTGIFFDYMKDKRSTRIAVPQYIYDVDKYITDNRERARILLLPHASNDLNADTYIWKYWSLASVTSLLSNTYTVTNRNNDQEYEVKLVDDLYKAIENNDPVWQKIMYIFGIDTVILRRDYAVSEDQTTPADLSAYDSFLSKNDVFLPSKTVGMWQFYDVKPTAIMPPITALPDTLVISDYFDKKPFLTYADFYGLFQLKEIDAKTAIVISELNQKEKLTNITQAEQFFSPICSFCSLRDNFESFDLQDRILPNSLFFPFIQFQEKQMLAQETDWQKKEQLYITIMKKRAFGLREIRRMGKVAPDSLVKAENLLASSIQNVLDSINHNSIDPNTDTKRMLAVIDDLYVIKQQLVQRMQENTYEPERSILINTYSLVSQALQDLPAKANKSKNIAEKQYRFSVNNSADYDVLINKATLANATSSASLNQLSLQIDNKVVPVVPTQASSNWYKLSQTRLDAGQHDVTLTDQSVTNLFSLTSLSSNLPIGATMTPNGFTISASALEPQCVSIPVTGLEEGEVYEFAYTYQIPDQFRRMIFKWDKDHLDYPTLLLKGHYLVPAPIPQRYEEREIVSSNSVTLHFCSEYVINRNIPRDANFSISDISVKKISQPKIVIFSHIPKAKITPEVYFERINPTQYHIRVTNNSSQPFMLSFAERYNSQWKLYPVKTNWQFLNALQVNPDLPTFKVSRKDVFFDKNILMTWNNTPLADSQHFLINGFANGWWINQEGSQDYILLYDKQKRYYYGAVITVVGVIVLLLIGLSRLVKKLKLHKT